MAKAPYRDRPDEEHETPLLRLVGAEPREPAEKRLHARVDGYDLHASPPIQAEERAGLERFIRYAMRGPLANSRLAKGPKGRLLYRLKTPKADGTTEVVLLKPMVLLERLARLIPLPGTHMVRFHGVLAPAATWRNLVVAKPRDTQVLGMPRVGARRIDWASLMKRVFAVEILACACGGTQRVIATIRKGPWRARSCVDGHWSSPTLACPTSRHGSSRKTGGCALPASVSQLGLWETGPPSDDAPAPPTVDGELLRAGIQRMPRTRARTSTPSRRTCQHRFTAIGRAERVGCCREVDPFAARTPFSKARAARRWPCTSYPQRSRYTCAVLVGWAGRCG